MNNKQYDQSKLKGDFKNSIQKEIYFWSRRSRRRYKKVIWATRWVSSLGGLRHEHKGLLRVWKVKIASYVKWFRFVTAQWNSKNSNLTCGWLISEVLRKLMEEENFNKKTYITGLKNFNPKTSEVYDFLLTQMESSLSFIKGADSL